MGNITLYHNTSNQNAVKINTEGIKGGMRLSVYGKGSEAEGAGIWCSTVRGYGYGGATITFEIDENDENLVEQNDTEYIVYRNIKPEEIIDIDLMVSSISSVQGHTNTVESDIPSIINKFGKDKLLNVFKKNEGKFVSPYNYDTLINLIETENKYCKGKIQILESKRITEGIHLYGYVTDEDGNSKVIEDSDYPDKKSFENDLRCNGYKVRKIKDNRDMYLVDNSDFVSVDAVKKRIKELQKDIDNGFSALGQKNEIAKLKELLDNANKISLTESRKLKESIGNEWVQAQYDNLERLQDRLKQTLKIDSRLEYAKTGKPKLEFEYADRQFRTIFIRSAISKNRNGTFYLLYPDNKKFENTDSFERYIDEIGIAYRNNKKKVESKKLEEASRNELLAKSKAETITRYNKSAGYKGFSLVDIDTTSIKTRDAIVITNRVGDYFDTIELDDILYWVGLEVDEARDKKMSLETVRKALLGAMDGMNIKVDCNCGDFVYRFAYMASVLEYKYGKPENRPSNITNPNGYGAMCKHLISLLSNKSWVKQVASTLQQWIVDEIDWVRDFLKVSEEDFQLPDEYARQLGKHGAMKKFWDKTPDVDEADSEEDIDDSNEDAPETEENNEETNDTPDTNNLNNQSNMPKAFRDNNSNEELEEK